MLSKQSICSRDKTRSEIVGYGIVAEMARNLVKSRNDQITSRSYAGESNLYELCKEKGLASIASQPRIESSQSPGEC